MGMGADDAQRVRMGRAKRKPSNSREHDDGIREGHPTRASLHTFPGCGAARSGALRPGNVFLPDAKKPRQIPIGNGQSVEARKQAA
jgi:hypothetical protein